MKSLTILTTVCLSGILDAPESERFELIELTALRQLEQLDIGIYDHIAMTRLVDTFDIWGYPLEDV